MIGKKGGMILTNMLMRNNSIILIKKSNTENKKILEGNKFFNYVKKE